MKCLFKLTGLDRTQARLVVVEVVEKEQHTTQRLLKYKDARTRDNHTHLVFFPRPTHTQQRVSTTPNMDPIDHRWREMIVREKELQVANAEYWFLAMCGGVHLEDVQRLRAGVTGVVPTVVTVKVEDMACEEPAASEIVPLKQMIRDLLVGSGPSGETQLNALCRSVRIACGDALWTVMRHHSSCVRAEDREVVRAGLARVLRERVGAFEDV